ncbi:MAG: DUF2889 domain-containing protein [Hyphomonadaceae bacterium]|nr:DUF2889 domain-containing protein [Hyphomonadaceae bacterium]
MPGFHRTIIISTRNDDDAGVLARACVEDDFHQFRVQVSVKDGIIGSASGTAIRFPYITCPGAEEGLDELIGQRAEAFSAAVYRQADTRLNCTHMLDLAGLAISNIVNNVQSRRYDIFVSDRDTGEKTGSYTANIARDGIKVLEWQATNETINSPKSFAGVHLRKGFAKWALNNLDPEETEAALILRRCSMISMGRAKDLAAQRNAPDWGFCYSQQKERAHDALRIKGAIEDFNSRAGDLCKDDEYWVNFEPEPTHSKNLSTG